MSKVKKILAVVDNSEYVYEGLRQNFEYSIPGLELVWYGGGKQILQALGEGKRFDLILMDGKLQGGFTGPLYTKEIIENYPESLVIGYSTGNLAKVFLENGAKYFVSKGMPLQEFAGFIKKVLGI